MDAKSLERLIADHRRFPAALRALVAGASAGELREREREGRWSPLEVLVHLVDEEVHDFRARARAAAEGGPLPGAVDPEAWVRSRRYNERDPVQVLDELEEERRTSCAWLETLRQAELSRALRHPQLGELRCGDFVAAWRVHDLLHLRQLAGALAVLQARRLSEWRTGYAGSPPG